MVVFPATKYSDQKYFYSRRS